MSSTSYVIRGGEVVTPAGIVRACVLVADGRIRKVGEVSGAEAAGAQVVDARGRFVLPGLVELHVQGAGGSDLFSDEPDAVHNVCRSLAAFGTTAFLATTAVDTARDDQPHIRQIVEAASAQPPGASILGIHLEGPFISPEKRGMIRPSHICRVSRHYYERIGNMCGGWLRMMTIAPELPGALELVRDMAASGIVPALGHTNATYEEALRGLGAGLRHVTHMMNAMRSFHHREPGAVGAVLIHDEFTMQIISDGVHLHPEVVAWLVRMKGPSRLSIITDGMAATGMPPGRYTYAGVEYSVQDGAARYADGTLIGTACTQLELVRRARQFAGLDLAEAVNMASLYPARILGVDDRKASIAEGRDADLLICDCELKLEGVFVRGAPVCPWDQ